MRVRDLPLRDLLGYGQEGIESFPDGPGKTLLFSFVLDIASRHVYGEDIAYICMQLGQCWENQKERMRQSTNCGSHPMLSLHPEDPNPGESSPSPSRALLHSVVWSPSDAGGVPRRGGG